MSARWLTKASLRECSWLTKECTYGRVRACVRRVYAHMIIDPVGVAECYLLVFCLVRQLADARSAKCRQVV